MPTPTALDNARTSTPDGTNGIQIATVVAQEGTIEIPGGVLLSTRLGANTSADRSGVTADSTADMDAADGFGSTGLISINNCGALVVYCKFDTAGASATIEVVFYDGHTTAVPLFVSKQLTFAALSQRVNEAGDYLSNPQIIDSYGASKCRPYVKSLSAGTVDVWCAPV